MSIYTNPDNQPFQVGDKIRCIDPRARLVNGRCYTVREMRFTVTDDEWMLRTEELPEEFYANRFEAVDIAPVDMKSKTFFYPKVKYGIESHPFSPASAIDRKNWLELKKFRKIAAISYLFEKGPAEKIRKIKEALKREKPAEKILVNPKYNIRIPYVPMPGKRDRALKTYKADIHYRRQEMREIQDQESNTGFSDLQKIHRTPGGVVNLYYKKALIPKKLPKDGSSYIGIEIELMIPRSASFAELMTFKDQLSVGDDGSISDMPKDYISKEIRLLTTAEKYQSDLNKLCAILANMKAQVNASCGLHVHLDMRAYSKEEVTRIYTNLVKSQKFLQGLVTENRIANHYCKPTFEKDPYQEYDRYNAINAAALHKFGTLEVRLHHGTLDSLEIVNWISLLLSICKAETIKRTAPTLAEFMNKVNVPETLKTYIEKKIRLTPVVTAVPQRSADPNCVLDHEGEICLECENSWGSHDGHDCWNEETEEYDNRGRFPGCTRVRVEVASATINPRYGSIEFRGGVISTTTEVTNVQIIGDR
jgi:hypothetical protein